MNRCPTCGQPRREPLSTRDTVKLEGLREVYPGFTYAPERDTSGHIDSHYDGKPMIGNRTVANVRDMLRAMSEGRRA